MKDYNVVKKEVDDYFEKKLRLLPSQKILKKIEALLSDSRRYLDYCNELKNIINNNIEIIALADFFFLDCSIVFQEQTILKLAILFDNDIKTVCIEKFFNILNSEDAKKFKDKTSIINNFIKTDRVKLQNIRQEFIKFKEKRDREVAHIDIKIINRESIISFDLNHLIDIQTRTFDLLEKYFEILSLPNPTKLSDYSSFESLGITIGLKTINQVSIRTLNELDFSGNKKVLNIINSAKIAKEIKKHG